MVPYQNAYLVYAVPCLATLAADAETRRMYSNRVGNDLATIKQRLRWKRG